MAGKRGPESFMKRQRERQKQQEQMEKDARRRARSAEKKEAKRNNAPGPIATLRTAPLGPVSPRGLSDGPPR
jgi:hypothetical protein